MSAFAVVAAIVAAVVAAIAVAMDNVVTSVDALDWHCVLAYNDTSLHLIINNRKYLI